MCDLNEMEKVKNYDNDGLRRNMDSVGEVRERRIVRDLSVSFRVRWIFQKGGKNANDVKVPRG